MGLIYMRISPSGGKYIGQTALQEEKRWERHYQESCSPKRKDYNSILNKAIRKYGKDNFEVRILEDNIPQEKLNEREAFWIEKYKTYYKDGNHGYNMTRGGDGVVRYKAESFMELWNQGFSSGEIGKILNDKYWYPDMVLHGGQGDPENNRVVVEIKRECMVKGNYKVILEDFKKLSSFLKSEEKSSQDDCKFRNYKNAVFILLKGKIEEISNMLKAKKVSQDEINGNIICLTYNGEEIEISRLSHLM